MAKRTKRRNTRRRISKKNNKTRKRKTRRIRRKMRGGETWTCKKCKRMTNQDPCMNVIGRKPDVVTLADGTQQTVSVDVYCKEPKPKPNPNPKPKPNPFDSLNPF
jgi:hypothetical protein